MLFMRDGIQLMAELEVNGPGWVTFGVLGGGHRLLVDNSEWRAFVDMVNEVDAEWHRCEGANK